MIPSFQKQQNPAAPSGQQQDSAKGENKGHGKQGGKKQKEKRKKKHLNFIELKDSNPESASLYFMHTTFVLSMVDPQVAVYQSVQLYQRSVSSPDIYMYLVVILQWSFLVHIH